MALDNPSVIDLKSVVAFISFEVITTAVTEEEGGARVWLPAKV